MAFASRRLAATAAARDGVRYAGNAHRPVAGMRLNDLIDLYRSYTPIDEPGSPFAALLGELAQLRSAAWLHRALRAGDLAPDFQFPDMPQLWLSDLLRDGPIVLKFYRGRWCPFCALELRALQRALPGLRALGAELVALSPQNELETAFNRERDRLDFPMHADLGNLVARRFGIVYELDEAMRRLYRTLGIDLPDTQPDAGWTLPLPATYLIAPDRRITWAYVDPDYLHRAEPAEVLAELERLPRG